MASILTCPTCGGAISLPAGPVAHLECPHCRNELTLHAAPPPVAPTTAAPSASKKPPVEPPRPSSAPVILSQPAGSSRNRPASRPQRPGMFGQLVGIVGGGFLGLVVGYWLLNFFGGPRYNMLGIWMPGIAHTQPGAEEIVTTPPVLIEPAAPVPPPSPLESQPAQVPPAPRSIASLPDNQPASPTAEAAVSDPAFPSYSAEDLRAAIIEVQSQLGCSVCGSTGFIVQPAPPGLEPQRVACRACGGKPAARITSDVFEKLCRLAHVVTFVELYPDDPDYSDARAALDQVLSSAAGDREKQNALGRLAGYALSGQTQHAQGVMLAGTIQDVGQQGRLHWTRIVLMGRPDVITVVSTARVPQPIKERVLIAGAVIDDPAALLPGFRDPPPRVVWGGLTLKLPDDSR